MRLYNSLTRKKEEFIPGPDRRVALFVCGPTVYDLSHIGHARTYLVYDGLVKYMRRRLGWAVDYLQNLTNIDDKIIERGRELGKDPLRLSEEMEDKYLRDMKALQIDSVSTYARATDHVSEVVRQVERLLEKGSAYEIAGDGIYFDVSTFKGYGKLSGRTTAAAEDALTRIDESVHKRNKADFVLWKFSKAGEPSWEAPFGKGRPGWHIEDTAITEKFFGSTYDVHGGALELIFPHHEAEIAEMESLSGVSPMARFWVHTGVLTIGGKKMSKSLGNFITIEDFLKSHSAATLRMLVFSSHYRSPLDYALALADEARERVSRIVSFVERLQGSHEGMEVVPELRTHIEEAWTAREDDFNTSLTLTHFFELITKANKRMDTHTLSRKDAQSMLDFAHSLNDILSIIPLREAPPAHVQTLMEEREGARKSADFEKADELRKEIEKAGWTVEDTPEGPRVTKRN
jgi:cysteinyl-tRNA synthetase